MAERGGEIDAAWWRPTSSRALRRMIERSAGAASMTVDHGGARVQGHSLSERLDNNAIHRLSGRVEALVSEPIDAGSTHFSLPRCVNHRRVGNKGDQHRAGVARPVQRARQRPLDLQDAVAPLEERIDSANAAMGGTAQIELSNGG